MRTYAIGDIHGHLDLLIGAHALIAEDRARCGDMGAQVDEGLLLGEGA